MTEPKRITQQFLDVVRISDDVRATLLDRVMVPIMLVVGVLYMGVQGLQGHWLDVLLFAPGILLLVALASSRRLQETILGQAFSRRHALYIAMFWLHSTLWLGL